jgi:ubiquinone/menaquinone biosynthesis C-methylase UbiE
MNTSDHITQITYDSIAPEFANINNKLSPDLQTALERFIELVGTSAHVLDLGCGTGRDVVFMQSHGLQVAGADFSMGMLTEAKACGAVRLVQMDMIRIGFADACFQGVWCNASLLHLPKQSVPLVLAEIQRVLVPKGVLFVAVQEGATEGYEPNPYAQSSLERFFARYTQDEIQSMLRESSFTLIESAVLDAGKKRWVHVYSVTVER